MKVLLKSNNSTPPLVASDLAAGTVFIYQWEADRAPHFDGLEGHDAKVWQARGHGVHLYLKTNCSQGSVRLGDGASNSCQGPAPVIVVEGSFVETGAERETEG